MWTCIHSPTALGSLSLMAGSCVESLNGVPSTCVGSIASNVGVVARTARRLAVRCVLHRSLATHPSSAWMARSTTTNGGDCELLHRVPTETMLRSYHDDVPRARCPCAWQELGGKNVNIDVYIRQRSWAKHKTLHARVSRSRSFHAPPTFPAHFSDATRAVALPSRPSSASCHVASLARCVTCTQACARVQTATWRRVYSDGKPTPQACA